MFGELYYREQNQTVMGEKGKKRIDLYISCVYRYIFFFLGGGVYKFINLFYAL